jgi:hypothetical protein
MLAREHANQNELSSLPNRPGLMHLATAASSSEDFRSVIDDLTVQNKKLKRKLKKYEKFHDGRLQHDKLFEIRVHGLPPHKKRELEETLQKFALSLDGAPQTSSSGRGSEQLSSLPPQLEQQLTAGSSLTNVDSAYASASGQQSSTQSGNGKLSHSILPPPQVSKSSISSTQQRDIQTYLSDIPQGLLPKPVAMTEKSKKKVIVRRLEQIFAGKGASSGGHQQPLQQQEISQSAARADRTEREAAGRMASKEGAREARIMRGKRRSLQAEDAESRVQPIFIAAEPLPRPDHAISSTDFAKKKGEGEGSPDQRPTRPLDLDPNRAQVPEDNIKYLRHLGFSPLEVNSEEHLIDGHGYMYLNVLINMAQLHTLNVTPEFVKKAVEQYSDKLELSNDGRKVRWKGGNDMTQTSSNGSPDDNSNGSSKPLSRTGSRSKGWLTSASGASSDPRSTSLGRKEPENKMAYVPLFYRQEEDDDEDDDSDNISEWSSTHEEPPPAADSSGLTSSGKRTSSSKKRQGNDGPIIFYNKAPFVTDLSGDWRGANTNAVNVQDYSSAPVNAIGMSQTMPALNRTFSKGPLSKPQAPATIRSSHSIDTDEGTSGESIHGFSKPASMKTAGSSTGDSPDQMEFEASGVGGVHPSDNFALNVKSRHQLSHLADRSGRKNYSPHIRSILVEGTKPDAPKSGAGQTRSGEILRSQRTDLPPSELPPPSYFPLSSPEEEEDFSDSDDEDEVSVSPGFNGQTLPASRPQPFKWTDSNDIQGDSDDEDGEASLDEKASDPDGSETDGSPDMLAHARKANPEMIRLAEREYEAGIAERLAADIPAGSSAATAGGGSGFNTPVSANDRNTDGSPAHGGAEIKSQMPARGILKRTRTDGSQGVYLARKSKSPKLDKIAPFA